MNAKIAELGLKGVAQVVNSRGESRNRKLTTCATQALMQLVPGPGLSLLMNKSLRRKAGRAARVALLGAGVVATVPLALYVICKTSPGSKQTN